MANLTENPTYDAGVYQLETTDPVVGGAAGISNAPLINLANRTTYLKQHVDSLETNMSGYAPLASPIFTGSARAVTQALGDNSTKIATDEFVQGTVGGVLLKTVSGGVNVTLTAPEAGNGILVLSGTLTADIAVIVPTSPTRSWLVKNNTSGAFKLTIKTAAGSGVVCSQGKNTVVWTDGVNAYYALTDFDSPSIIVNPLAPASAVAFFPLSAAPDGWIKANGASLSTTLYSRLFSAIGYTFGGSGGSFLVPDLRGEFLRGWDDGRGVDSARVSGSLQLATNILTGGINSSADASYTRPAVNVTHSEATTLLAGNRLLIPLPGPTLEPFNYTLAPVRPRNIALLACIKY